MKQETGDTAAAATTAADDTYAAGMRVVGDRPDLLAACERAADRAARRLGDMGDTAAETCALTIDAVARWAGKHGLPADSDNAAALITSLAKESARRARDAQRGQWAPRVREARPSDAPNRMERWNTASLVNRASRYTMGALDRPAPTTPAQREARSMAVALLTVAGHRVRTTSARERAQAVLDAHAEYAWPIVHREARVTRVLANGERVVSSERVGGAICAPRHSGSTSPAAESAWRAERDAVRMRAAMGAAMGADTVDALTAAYRPERVRRIKGRGKRVGDVLRVRRVSWQHVAAGTGRDRGTVRRETVRGAGRVAALMARGERADHAAGRTWCALESAATTRRARP